jgi:metal-responsive CopG/Arc/MetJ family transcriptional regulator
MRERRKAYTGLSLDRDLLREITEVARAERLPRSTLINLILAKYLQERKGGQDVLQRAASG